MLLQKQAVQQEANLCRANLQASGQQCFDEDNHV